MNFPYTVIRRPYRKTLCINISSDNKIVVKASRTISLRQIKDFLQKKSEWIKKAINFNYEVRKKYIPKKFENGENFLHLGKEYPLLIKEGHKFLIAIDDAGLSVTLPKKHTENKTYLSKKIIQWYKSQAYKKLLERISFYEPLLKTAISGLQIRSLQHSWGNCSRKGAVTFSWKLIMATLPVIDYVVIHELCHLIHHNHSLKFWQEVQRLMPGYKEHKQWLKINDNTLKL